MQNIISFKRYICGKEEFNFSELYRQCTDGKKILPINVFLFEHRKYGNILINTGCSRYLKKNPVAFAKFCANRKIMFKESDEFCSQYLQEGIDPLCIKKVLLTHCLPECCGGLPMLPKYEIISTAQVLTVLWLSDPSDGIMKSTLPSNEIKRRAAGIFGGNTFLKDYFKWIFDVFGDGTVLAADISGYASQMAGYYFTEKNIFIAADASINSDAIERGLIPSDKLLRTVSSPDDYISVLATLRRLHKDHPEIKILFSHSENIPV